ALPLFGQDQNVNVLGRWADGRCEAVFRRGGFTFVGNGSFLDVYQRRNTVYQRLDQILLPASVKDVWVKGDTTHVFVACGDSGLNVAYFDYRDRRFKANAQGKYIIGRYQTTGYASAIMEQDGYTYVADGPAGLTVLNTDYPSNPYRVGSFSSSGYARELWIENNLALVAADTAGLYAIDITNKSNPILLDKLQLPQLWNPDQPASALSVLVPGADTLAYVGAGWGGLQIISIQDPSKLSLINLWPSSGIPLFVQDVWVSGQYAHLACRDQGLHTQIDISDVGSITGPVAYALETEGQALKIVVDGDTAFTADAHHGHLVVDVDINNPNAPSIQKTVAMADASYDVAYQQDYLYVAAGLSGLKIFHTQSEYTDQRMTPVGSINTPGTARGVATRGGYAFVADGNQGVRILEVTNKNNPLFRGAYTPPSGFCHDVAVPPGSFIFAAFGHDGFRVLDYSNLNAIASVHHQNTPGSARSIKIVGNTGYLADSTGVHVYNFAGLPVTINVSEVTSLTSDQVSLEALSVDATGDTVLIANGRYGLLIWNHVSGTWDSFDLGGRCTDVKIVEKTIYVTVEEKGIVLFNYAQNGEINRIGSHPTAGRARRLDVSEDGERIWVASGEGGLYDLISSLKPQISVNPTSLDFGSVPPGYIRSRKLWISNLGTKDLVVDRIQIVGLTTAFSFSETAFTVPPGETKRILVSFSPPLLGASSHVATASIYSNATDSPTTLFLQGEGGTPNLQVPYRNDVFTLGLWHFDEADGVSTVNDASGNNLVGTPLGQTPRVEAKPGFGRAIRFNGDGGRIQIPNHALLNIYNTQFSLELWFSMIQKTAGTAILAKRGMGQTQQVELALSAADGLVGRIWDPSGNEHFLKTGSLQSFNTDQWYHAAISWDGDSLRLFLNGIQKDGRPYYGTLRNVNDQPLIIAAQPDGTNPFFGLIDEVRLSSIARQPWEFNVNQSRLEVAGDPIRFGNVIVGQVRRLPLLLRSAGEAPLTVYGVSATDNRVSVSARSGFTLHSGQDTTLWLTFLPEVTGAVPEAARLVIASTDPTFPFLEIPITGRGFETFAAGTQKTDPFTLGLYHFSQVRETTVFDSSGYGFDGTLHGGVVLDTAGGKFGRYLHINGVTEYCSVDSLRDPVWGSHWGGFTAEAWIHPNRMPVDSSAIILKRGTDEQMQFDIRLDRSARVTGRFWNSAGQVHVVISDPAEPLDVDQWYHVACTLDMYADSLTLYINGRRVAQTRFTGRFNGSLPDDPVHGTRLYIGGDASQLHSLIGYIDEVRISGIARDIWEFTVNLARSHIFPVSIDFGKVLLGQNRVEHFWVRNTGLEVLGVENIQIIGEEDVFRLDQTAFDLVPGDARRIAVTYTPDRVGSHEATVRVTSNNLFPDRPVSLQGVCIDEKETGTYENDAYTLNLIHFEQQADTQLVTFGPVFWSDTSRFGSSSMRFKGGYAYFGSDTTIDLSTTPLTAELWFALAAPPDPRSILLLWGNTDSYLLFQVNRQNDAGIQAVLRHNEQSLVLKGIPFSRLNLNQWVHVALSWDGDTLRWYNNNRLYDKAAFSGDLTLPENSRVQMGANFEQAFPLFGWIDEFRLSLTARQPWEFNVLPPVMTLSVSRLSFPSVPVNQTGSRELVLSNLGDQDLIITAIQSSDDVFTVSGFSGPDTLPRFNSRRIQVMFKPTQADRSFEGTLQIFSNDTSAATRVIALSGQSLREKRNQAFDSDDPNTRILYHFDRNPAFPGVLYDNSGGGRHGVIHGATWVETGLYGDALFFDGNADWIAIPSSDAFVFDLEKDPFTIEFSFLTDTITTRQWFVAKGGEDSLHYGIYLDQEGRLHVPGFGGGGPRLSDGRWHQVAFVYNPADTSVLYVDGRPILARRWINREGTDTGDSLRIGAAVDVRGYRRGFFRGLMDELRISDIARDLWEIRLGDYGILTAVSDAQRPLAGEDLTLDIQVPAGLTADSVDVYFRRGGQRRQYTRLSAERNTTLWNVTLPADSVTLQGVEYYVYVISSSGLHYTAPPFSPVQNPHSMPVHHGRIDDRLTFHAQRVTIKETGAEREQQAALFSIPTLLNAQRVDSVFRDLLPYNPYEWRLFWWHSRISQERQNREEDAVYLEHPQTDPNYFNIGPGRAFWLVTKSGADFRIPSGQSMPTDTVFEIQVNPGWNMIGSPFAFPVSWDDCIIVGSERIGSVYAWRGSEGFSTDIRTLKPWEGYFIYNPDSLVVRLIIPPREAQVTDSDANAPLSKRHIAFGMEKEEWMIRFSAESRGLRSLSHYAGARIAANPGLDRFDRIEPPPSLGDEIRLFFDNTGWKTHPARYAADIRQSGEEGYRWEMGVRNSSPEEVFQIEWTFLNALPDGWGAYLLDLEEGNTIDLSKTETVTRKSPSKSADYSFRLLVGSPAFIEENREGFVLEPVTFALHQNYPNPFNPETTIRYSIPRAGEITLSIFNVVGQQIFSSKTNHPAAGHYQVVWQGVNDYGHPVASGVYFYKLKTPENVATRKMVIIR
ncbi:MAG TPA: choice-of-anchor D domain-containing protein, partial [bacterium]|nr:choice-of-anchor D domain-containing protein [bacterium]